ncbi:hypothetical protein HS048_31605 [Planomonospora sp. ID91781]|uniref:hypothetical protein n=1 Tax=Planomonospora sp. ID91781 TaxID=2738135 RepID=UPI0018C45059|nr:hypothetical protein [Planomonospora sp. ID91781]MBG0825238.1 hypothetical protein [Planomonospora sp. ID91781]
MLVVCPDARTAEYYARPVDSGLTGYRLQARVLGPDGVPVITDPQQAAARPELAAMAVMVHGRERKVVEAFAAALAELPDDHAPKYYEHAACTDLARLESWAARAATARAVHDLFDEAVGEDR